MVHFVFKGSTSWAILVAVAKSLGLEPKDLTLDVTMYSPGLSDPEDLLALYAQKGCSVFFTNVTDFALNAVALGKTVNLVTVRESGYPKVSIVSYSPGHIETIFPFSAQIVEIGDSEPVARENDPAAEEAVN